MDGKVQDLLQAAPVLSDVRDTTNHPYSLLYDELANAVILEAPIVHGRIQPGIRFCCQAPFFCAIQQALGSSRGDAIDRKVIADCLARYYFAVQPMTASEWLDLGVDKSHPLAQTPPWGAVWPWRARSLNSYREAYETAAEMENTAAGLNGGIEMGWPYAGPVASEKVRVESARLQHVAEQIMKYGYQRSDAPDGDARATALVNEEGEWRWLVTFGNHRVAAAAALGYDSLPLRVNLTICRPHVEFWPHVVDGLFTKSDALAVFDRVFDAMPPPYMNWEQNIDT